MRRVSDALVKAEEPLTQRAVLDRVAGRAQNVRQALAALVDERYVTTESGPGRATLHLLVKPFTAEEPSA